MKVDNDIQAKRPTKNDASPFDVCTTSFDNDEFSIVEEGFDEAKVINWPMVYILTNEKPNKAYVGQTTNVATRMMQHKANPDNDFKNATIICHDEFNGSVITDYEHRLIMLMAADGKYQLTNKNEGWYDRNYFSKEEYAMMFENLWESLRKKNLVNKTIKELEESEIFKYSPYKELNEDQERALEDILSIIKKKYSETKKSLTERNKAPIVVKGMPGTGKTILLIYLLKLLRDNKNYKNLKVKIVQPEAPLRATLQEVVKTIPGLTKNDIIAPTDLSKPSVGFVNGKNDFDILLVDEAHKLKQRQNIVNYASYDKTNQALFPGEDSEKLKNVTQLDWVMRQAKIPIFFYDSLQSIRPSGIYEKDYNEIINRAGTTNLQLNSQMRVQAGNDYLNFIQDFLNCKRPLHIPRFNNYEFVIHDNFDEFYNSFEAKLKNHKLTRMLAGYAWEWKKDPNNPDIELGSHKLFWNSDVPNWVGKGLDNSTIAHEVGCIHKIQGYDLSYAYVIIGNDITLNEDGTKLVSSKDNYYDTNGFKNASKEELDQYIKNIYYVLLTRGIKGTHIYINDHILHKYINLIS